MLQPGRRGEGTIGEPIEDDALYQAPVDFRS